MVYDKRAERSQRSADLANRERRYEMDSSFLIIFVTMLIGFLGLAIGLFVGLATLWTLVRNEIAGLRTEMQAMSARVSETELAQARREGEMRILAIIAHGHEAARGRYETPPSDGEDAEDG